MATMITKHAQGLGLKMVDAKKAITIEVSEKDIKGGHVKDPRHCAFAEACKRSSSGVLAAYFFRSTAWLEYDDRMVRYVLPPSVQKEIMSYDRGGLTAAGTYTLNAPVGSKTLKAIRKMNKANKDRNTESPRPKKRKVRHVAGIRTMHDQKSDDE